MDNLLFGISGLPLGDEKSKFKYPTGIKYLADIGLDAMELAFVRSVNITDKNKDEVKAAKEQNNIFLSAHGSYYINLNAVEDEKREKSRERIIKGAEGLAKVGGTDLVFHPGFYLKSSHEDTFNTIVEQLKMLPDIGVNYRLETTGKGTQFGSYEEIVQICKLVPTCKPCIDFAHVHARGNGCLKTYDDFAKILQYISDELGPQALKEMHVHLAGIEYSPKGEKHHLPFEESDFNYKACLEAFKDFDVKGCIVCESPILEHDALLLKNYYESL